MPLIFGSERRLAHVLGWEREGREEREKVPRLRSTTMTDDGVVDCLEGVAPAPSDTGGKSLP